MQYRRVKLSQFLSMRTFLVCLGVVILVLSTLYLTKRYHLDNKVQYHNDPCRFHILGFNLSHGYGYRMGLFANEKEYKFQTGKQNIRRYLLDCHKRDCYFFRKPPGYPLFLSLMYKIFGANPLVVRFIQCFFLALGAALLPVIGYHYWSKAGILAGVISAVLFIRFFSPLPHEIMAESFTFFFLLILTLGLMSWEVRPHGFKVFLLGLGCAYLFLIKEITAFVAILMLVYICFHKNTQQKRSVSKIVILFFSGYLLISLPWMTYRSLHSHQIGFLRPNWPNLLLDANNEDVINTGLRSDLWRYENPRPGYLYRKPEIAQIHPLKKYAYFLWHYRSQIPSLWLNKLRVTFSKPQGSRWIVVAMLLYYLLVLGKSQFDHRNNLKEFLGLERIPIFPGLYFLGFFCMTLIFHGRDRFLEIYLYFYLLPAIYLPLFIFKNIMNIRKHHYSIYH